jgi:hypothetical protein
MKRYLREKVNALIDCRQETAAAIFRRYNLVRFCQPRTFRRYVADRRRWIGKYEAQRARRRRAQREAGDAK